MESQKECSIFEYKRNNMKIKNNHKDIRANKKESEDELSHAKKLEDFMVLWNVTPNLPVITQPVLEFTDLADGIQRAYDMEYELYENYEETSIKIMKSGDVCAFDLLQFFRNQQTTSVGEYSDMINKLDGVNTKDKFQMLMLEKKLF